ncbi:cation diffusion facilitator family transporter [Lachnospiraceae bacterium C1.1]|nr:cation diffusion facilitator family transporter [Lachnospiraceae bacterium C1.1]
MIALLTKIFIKDSENLKDPGVRRAYGMLTAIVGIILNSFVFSIKAFAGITTGSLAILADGFNNLSDAGSSFLSMLGYSMAGKEADADHPFGHGRIEYIMGLIVSIMIIVVGCELLTSSAGKIFNPEEVRPSALSAVILIISIFIKLYMYSYNKAISRKINSAAMAATAADSLSDCVATTVVLISTVVLYLSGKNIDGISGVIVALFIIYEGISAAKETVAPLLGQPPSKELVDDILRIVNEYPEVLGTHDLLVHDYGPGRRMISIHAEVSGDRNIYELHDAIDRIERELKTRLGCEAVIHMDPVDINDKKTEEMAARVRILVEGITEGLSIHDFRVDIKENSRKLYFDVQLSSECILQPSEVERLVKKEIKTLGDYEAVINVDR